MRAAAAGAGPGRVSLRHSAFPSSHMLLPLPPPPLSRATFLKNCRCIVCVCNLCSVDASEVVQGALGDCWLAAALSIVTQQPLLLHALFAAADIRAGGTVSCTARM
eukprot:COSAG06_NODE_12015_length_1435_cov_1.717066_1_plen_105_part_10